MKTNNLHLNWGACRDWHAARARLSFLSVPLYGNFADVRKGRAADLADDLRRRGFSVSIETYCGNGALLRMSDATV